MGVRANVVGSVAANTFGTSEGGGTPLASLFPEQMRVLLNMINNEQMSRESTVGMEWIIDTGASCHITALCLV